MSPHDFHTRKILTLIEMGGQVTQRVLARELGVALGLTNLLVRRIVKKGWVKVSSLNSHRVRYLITPRGVAEKARITCEYFHNTTRLYTETRERIRQRLEELSTELSKEQSVSGRADDNRIAFYGAGEVAEIAYISLQTTNLRLVLVVDDCRRESFFGIPVQPPSVLSSLFFSEGSFRRLVVMSFRGAEEIRERLDALQFPQERVFWL